MAALRAHQKLFQVVHEQHAIGQSGQGIVCGEVLTFAAGPAGVVYDRGRDENAQQHGDCRQQIHPETGHFLGLMRFLAGFLGASPGFGIEL